MSSTGAMTLPESEAPQQPPPRRRTRKITVGGRYPAPAAQGHTHRRAAGLRAPDHRMFVEDGRPEGLGRDGGGHGERLGIRECGRSPFDTGLGDLFVLRTGRAVVGPVVTGSVEYGPLASGTPLIVVLGHQRCGAIKAAYRAMKAGEKLPGGLQAIADALKPAYDEALKDKHPDPVDAMIRIHTEQTSVALRSNQDLAPLVKKGGPSVASDYYSIDTGRAEVLTGAPAA